MFSSIASNSIVTSCSGIKNSFSMQQYQWMIPNIREMTPQANSAALIPEKYFWKSCQRPLIKVYPWQRCTEWTCQLWHAARVTRCTRPATWCQYYPPSTPGSQGLCCTEKISCYPALADLLGEFQQNCTINTWKKNRVLLSENSCANLPIWDKNRNCPQNYNNGDWASNTAKNNDITEESSANEYHGPQTEINKEDR